MAGKNEYEKKLYQLIRSRTLATQMKNAVVAKTSLYLEADTVPNELFKATGEMVIFDGFLKVYGKSKDTTLPNLQIGDPVKRHILLAKQTFSKPPARYTEGSLVKKLEELGIGRPSTYASIINAIQVRNYVVKGESEGEPRDILQLTLDEANQISEQTISEKTGSTKGKLMPTPVGELVSNFLCENFKDIVDYDFTAGIEEKLDLIAEKKLTRLKMLRDFYGPFSDAIGASAMANRYNSATELGTDPKTGKKIYAKIGKNGGFLQLGENEKESGEKPIFIPLPKGKTVKTVTLEQALKQLELPVLPRSLGHAKDGTELIAANGPFGPFIKAGAHNIALSKINEAENPYHITLETAEALYQKKIDSILADWGDIKIINGPFGPYIKGPVIKPASGKGRARPNNAKIPKDRDPKSITREEAEEILLSSKAPADKKTSTKKSTTKKTTTKKATAKKTAAKTRAKVATKKS